jgi:hypothetical protein
MKQKKSSGDWFSPYLLSAETSLKKLMNANPGNLKQTLTAFVTELETKYKTDDNKSAFTALRGLVGTVPEEGQIALNICMSKKSLQQPDNWELMVNVLASMLAMSDWKEDSNDENKKA